MSTTTMATERQAMKLTMMAMTTPMVMGNDDNDGDDATGKGEMVYDDDNNGEG